MKKSFKILFGMMLMLLCFTLSFSNVNAADEATITVNVDNIFYLGETKEFTATTGVSGNLVNTMVVGISTVDESAIGKLEYYEVQDGQWHEFSGKFGPDTGFPLTDGATSKFRVSFKKAGTYEIKFQIKKVSDDQSVLATTTKTIEVKAAMYISNQEELLAALKNKEVKEIILSNDITTNQKINITRDITINGAGHKITLNNGDKNVWAGNYVLQAYKSNVTIRDIALTGGNAALLVNGGNVTLEGTVDVSGNGFGGIELSKGSGVTETPTIDVSNAKIVNSTEEYKKPTLWVDSENNDAVVKGMETKVGIDGQLQYYLEEENSTDNPVVNNNSTEEENEETTDSLEENPQTADITIFIVTVLIVAAIAGFAYTAKQRKLLK